MNIHYECMKKIIIKILSIFMMILMVVSGINVSVGALIPVDSWNEFKADISNYLKQEFGETVSATNEVNDYIDGEKGYIIKEDELEKEDLDYYKNFANNLFEKEENKKYLEENNFSDTAKYEVLNDWLWDEVTAGSLGYSCDGTCLNFVDCIVKGHREQLICQEVTKFNVLVLASLNISVAIEHSDGHVEGYPCSLLIEEKRWIAISTYCIDFVSGNILYSISVKDDGTFNITKQYIITHEHKYERVGKTTDSTCARIGEKQLFCSIGDKEHDCYCNSFITEKIPCKPHTFNNRIFNKKFHAGEYSTEKNINNAADTTGELINGKMTYTNCDGTTVSTENYGGYYNDQPKLNIWGYNNTDQEGALVTNNFHACEVAEVNRYVCDRTLDTDDMLCDDKFLYEITEPEEVTYTDKVIEATCDTGGYTLRTCNNCGESRKVNKSNTNALGCDFDGAELIIEKEPTCDASILGQGYGYQICKHEGCNKTNSVTITERAKHNLSIVVSGYSNIESVVNDSCVDQYVYGYVYCSVCDRRIKPTDINESDYPDVYKKYSDICDFDEYGNVKITVKATGNHKFITAYEYDKNGNPIPYNFCAVCQYKEYYFNNDDSNNKTPDNTDENNDETSDNNGEENNNVNGDANTDNNIDNTPDNEQNNNVDVDDSDNKTEDKKTEDKKTEDKKTEINKDKNLNKPVVCPHKSTRYKTIKATYTKSGKRVYYCKKCGAVVKTVKIRKLTLKVPKFKLYKGKRYFKVKYTKVKDATGFQVRYRIKGKWKFKTFKTKRTSIKFVKNLKKGKYIVKIRAFRAVKGRYVYSNWSRGKFVKVK